LPCTGAGEAASAIAQARSFLRGALGRGLGVLNRRFERSDPVCGRRDKLIDDGRVAVGQRLPARQAIADKPHQVRAIDELAVIGRVRRLDVRKIEDIHMLRGKSALEPRPAPSPSLAAGSFFYGLSY